MPFFEFNNKQYTTITHREGREIINQLIFCDFPNELTDPVIFVLNIRDEKFQTKLIMLLLYKQALPERLIFKING